MNPQGGEKAGPPPPNVATNAPPYGVNPPPYNVEVQNPAMPPIIHTTVIQAAAPPLGPDPSHMTCPSCHASITSKTSRETSTKTHLIALCMCLFGLWPCCLFPYCMDSCQNTNHHCPSCNAYLGQYKR